MALAMGALVAGPGMAQVPTGKMGALRPDQQRFFELYKELVETDTSVTTGNCTQAAGQIATRLKAAGFADEQITLFSVPDHSGHASGRAIEGSITGDSAVRDDLVPRLLALLDGKPID